MKTYKQFINEASGPNKTVSAIRNRKKTIIDEKSFSTSEEAKTQADLWKSQGKTVRTTTYKLGPKKKPTTRYMVRCYD